MEVPILAVALTFVAVVLLGMAPWLAAERFRALFGWPTDHVVANYALVGAGVALVQLTLYVLVVLATAGTGTIDGGEGVAALGGVAIATLVVPVGGALFAVLYLPERGVWSPDGEGLDGRIVLAGAAVWYLVLVGVVVVLAVLALLAFAIANMPT